MTYTLKVTKNLALIDYEYRLAVYRELVALIARHGVTHTDLKKATRAAEEISKHPLVVSVTMARTTTEGMWQQGERR
jgi:hypothetical protein